MVFSTNESFLWSNFKATWQKYSFVLASTGLNIPMRFLNAWLA